MLFVVNLYFRIIIIRDATFHGREWFASGREQLQRALGFEHRVLLIAQIGAAIVGPALHGT
jgi:hypothetical protein